MAETEVYRPPSRTLRDASWRNIIVIGGLHLLAAAAILWYAIRGDMPSARSIILGVALYFFTGLSVTLGYHRCFTHEGYRCHPVLTTLLLIGGGMSLQDDATKWVANHKRHHARADRPGDPHSPYEYAGFKGIAWAHVLWLLFPDERKDNLKYARKLQESRLFRLQSRYILVLMISGFVLPLLVAGTDGLLVAGVIRVVFLWNVTWSINSICHLVGSKVKVNGQVYDQDDSRNVWWLAWLTFGESWHGNHHYDQKSAFHGWRWWDIDLTKWCVLVFERLHLIKGVHRPGRQHNSLQRPDNAFPRP